MITDALPMHGLRQGDDNKQPTRTNSPAIEAVIGARKTALNSLLASWLHSRQRIQNVGFVYRVPHTLSLISAPTRERGFIWQICGCFDQSRADSLEHGRFRLLPTEEAPLPSLIPKRNMFGHLFWFALPLFPFGLRNAGAAIAANVRKFLTTYFICNRLMYASKTIDRRLKHGESPLCRDGKPDQPSL